MKRLIGSELVNAARTRPNVGIIAGFVVVVALAVLQTVGGGTETGKDIAERQFFLLAHINAQLFMLVLGAKIATDDFRHSTVVPVLLASPRRESYVIAKISTAAAAGAVAMLLAVLAMLATALPRMGAGYSFDGMEAASLLGFVAAGTVWAVLGASAGLIVRNQLGVIVGAVIWALAVEQLISARFNDLANFLPGNAGAGLAVNLSGASVALGIAVLAAYVIGSTWAAMTVTNRRDLA